VAEQEILHDDMWARIWTTTSGSRVVSSLVTYVHHFVDTQAETACQEIFQKVYFNLILTR
jgi:hypothetical protein